MHRISCLLGIALLGACGQPMAGSDAGTDSSSLCTATSCDDGLFCNGIEQCLPSGACAPAAAGPCGAGASCDEDNDTCGVCPDPDADGDGHDSVECGGDDCDDDDANRYPGNTDVCDSASLDEDCNLATFGSRDGDSDTFVDAECCNIDGTRRSCGDDCRDSDASVHPGEAETCDTLDNDCDELVDEGVQLVFYRDADGDGFGVMSMPRLGCSLLGGHSFTEGDCDDMVPATHVGAPELCSNATDDDCDSGIDEGCSCASGETQLCGARDSTGGFLMVGACHPGTQSCLATTGVWGPCEDNVAPTAETCDGVDEDCDESIDEGAQLAFYPDCDDDSFGSRGTDPLFACIAPASPPCPGGEWVRNNKDCNDTFDGAYPGAQEQCNLSDDDCDGAIDDPEETSMWCNSPDLGLPPHALSAECILDECVILGCEISYLDCDRIDPGCETQYDGSNCGECGRTCPSGYCYPNGNCIE